MLVQTLEHAARTRPALRVVLTPLILLRKSIRRLLNNSRDRTLDRLAALLVEDPVLEVDSFKGHFAVSAESSLFRQLVVHGDYESALARKCLELVDPKRDALDVGANIGLYSVLLARSLTDGRVLAIEPTVNALRRLRRNLAINAVQDKVTVFEGVASSTPGVVELKTIAGKEEYSSIGVLDHPIVSGKAYAKVDVSASTVDALVTRHRLSPGFMKIDVEGSEHLVIEGARQCLQIHRPVVILELSDFLLRRNGSSAATVVAELERLNYEVVDLLYPEVKPGKRDFCDVVCLPQ